MGKTKAAVKTRRPLKQPMPPWLYGLSALLLIIICVALLLLLEPKNKAGLFLTYVLIPLVPSFALFGFMRSLARRTVEKSIGSGNKRKWVALQLGGPVVLYLVLLGIGLKWGTDSQGPDDRPFGFTVFLRDAQKGIVVKEQGVLEITLDNKVEEKKINEEGGADFKGIPALFRGKAVTVEMDVPGWQFENGKNVTSCTLQGNHAVLIIQRTNPEDDSSEGFVLRGYVTLQNSDGQPVPGVTIIAFEGNPAATDKFGRFELVLKNRKPGDNVTLKVAKEGLEVVNRKELTVVLRSNPEAKVQIVMCKIGERDEYALRYYDIAKESIIESYEKRSNNIESLNIPMEEKDKAIADLTAQRDAALARAEELAKEFAKVNLDEASELYQEAFKYFKQGDIDKALEVLDDAKIEEAARRAQEEKRKAQARLEKADDAIRKNADNFILKAKLSILKLQFDKAETCYQKAVQLDENNVSNIWVFADFLNEQKQFHKALPLYERALSLAEDRDDRAALLNNLGVLYRNTSRFKEAESAYREALDIRRALAKENKSAYLPYVATTLNNLGLLYIQSDKYKDALKALNEALDIREKLANVSPAAFQLDLSETLVNLSPLYILTAEQGSIQTNQNKALSMLNRAISILKKYPHVPRAQQFLERANKLKNLVGTIEKEE